MKKNANALPEPVVDRLTKYLAHIQEVRDQGVEWISSNDLSKALGLTSSTVRQDLSHLDFSGVSKRGYETRGLERILVSKLGADRKVNVVIAGAGNLGRALALHEQFPKRGFTVRAIFDSNPRVIGKKVGKLTVRDMKQIGPLVQQYKARMGMIAVPASSAQQAADLMILAGIRGLLNFTCAHILVPKHVAVVDARLIASLWALSYEIDVRTKQEER